MDPLKQHYLSLLPDLPRWVETRDMLSVEGSIAAENATRSGFIIWCDNDLGSVVGEPNPEDVIRAADWVAAWEMRLFQNEELVNAFAAVQVTKSLYPYIPYDSRVEQEFARQLDQREDIKLFLKLPTWFKVETPLGGYNPDWAVVKQGDETLYLIRETKGTHNFLQLRTTEADKIRCGQAHFAALGVNFKTVVLAAEV